MNLKEEPDLKGKSPLILKEEPNLPLWDKIGNLARGALQEKIEAVELVFDNYTVVPEDADNLLKEMAGSSSPTEVRRKIAGRLVTKPSIPWVLHLALLETLIKDDDKEIVNTVEPLWRPYKALNESLVIPISKQIELFKSIVPVDFIENISRQAEISIPRSIIADIAQRVKAFSPEIMSGLQAQMRGLSLNQIPRFYSDILAQLRVFQENILRTASTITPSYYAGEQQLVEARKPSENPLMSKLRSIPAGRKHWHDYQSACKEILTFCLVPPLLSPTEESATHKGIHRRDILYPIPHGVGGFWGYVQNTFSASALIVEAKNYSRALPKDQVVITSKYFGATKLGNFGIIVSRRGPSDSAREEQIDRWDHHEEMMICLSDTDLEQMLLQKEVNNNPETILDRHIFELRKSI